MRYQLGIDAGSTTVKLVAVKDGIIVASSYERHFADVGGRLKKDLLKLAELLEPGARFEVCITGSAGMGVSQRCGLKFTQEMIAQVHAADACGYKNSTVIDIGGEDAKFIFLQEGRQPDIRMNGSCAGGTGAFIDQMASLMGVDAGELARLAQEGQKIYPIASRCGVFAKTDIQNLISRRLPLEDIAASIFRAVALQCAASLAKASDIVTPVVCVGGPLSFMPALRSAFAGVLKVDESALVVPQNARLFAAVGAASLSAGETAFGIDELVSKISELGELDLTHRLDRLFESEAAYEDWARNLQVKEIPAREINRGEHLRAYLGIDSGSTTTKIAVTDADSNLVFSRYFANAGAPLERAAEGVDEFYALLESRGASVEFISSAATGYGEDLIRAAFGIDYGIVETMAHLEAAKFVSGDVSFVLDIGGQDIKSIFVDSGAVSSVELNESCSSGCGSFLQGFAEMMNMGLADFARAACLAEHPCDLGTRCTVFMNSKVKESLRGQSTAGDIAAGLAYSVVKNCLFKVLKISNMEKLGRDIVVQGGTFRNHAVRRALELVSSRRVLSADMPELMGAYGAALYAKSAAGGSAQSSFRRIGDFSKIQKRAVNCTGCVNSCSVVRFKFENSNTSHAGNKCEKFFHSKERTVARGTDGVEIKYKKIFENRAPQNDSSTSVGIPRVLNMYENFPFWRALFEACGFNIVLSGESTAELAQSGISWLMSDNICFPAKLIHGHMLDLISRAPNRIFYPMAVMEKSEGKGAINSFNCPVVSGYPNVIKNTMDIERRHGIAFDTPVISFKNEKVLRDTAWNYFASLGVKKSAFAVAFALALKAHSNFKRELADVQKEILSSAIAEGRLVIVLSGRPYHADPLVNQKAAQIAADLGADVVSDDVFYGDENAHLEGLNYISQWTYPNRVMRTARAVSALPENVVMLQMNSFGCGPDSFVSDEAAELLKASGKNLTVVRVDEISSPGSLRLRLRSLVESLKARKGIANCGAKKYSPYRGVYTEADKSKTLIVPWFSDTFSPLVPALAKSLGYNAINLPRPTKESATEGLKYGHNEVCYPATIVVGDIIKFLKQAENPEDYVVAITQTGGQCRATNYLALIKNAMSAAGFSGVKIVSLNFDKSIGNSQPAFKLDKYKSIKGSIQLTAFADALGEMHSAMRVREITSGTADALLEKYLDAAKPHIETSDRKGLLALLENAVQEFNAIEIKNIPPRRVGFIGEIYLKYNAFSHCNLTDWLNEHGVEYVRPPLRSFLMQAFVNAKVNAKHSLAESGFLQRAIMKLAYKYAQKFLAPFDKILAQFKFARGRSDIFEMAGDASKAVNLVNQFGEGWLIAAEVAEFAKMNVEKVICVQPFGCIANHIVAKGIERKLKELYPQTSVLFLDIDSSVAPVNLQNRIHFLIA